MQVEHISLTPRVENAWGSTQILKKLWCPFKAVGFKLAQPARPYTWVRGDAQKSSEDDVDAVVHVKGRSAPRHEPALVIGRDTV